MLEKVADQVILKSAVMVARMIVKVLIDITKIVDVKRNNSFSWSALFRQLITCLRRRWKKMESAKQMKAAIIQMETSASAFLGITNYIDLMEKTFCWWGDLRLAMQWLVLARRHGSQ